MGGTSELPFTPPLPEPGVSIRARGAGGSTLLDGGLKNLFPATPSAASTRAASRSFLQSSQKLPGSLQVTHG